jgi:hypothetical protein
MVEMRVRLEGAEELKQRLRRAPGIVRKHMRRGVDRAVKTVQRKAQVYPPPPAASSYTRTGTLGRLWTSSAWVYGGSVQGLVGNPLWYGAYVMGDEEQAWMHRGRWKTLGQIVKETTKEILGFLEAALNAALREIGG